MRANLLRLRSLGVFSEAHHASCGRSPRSGPHKNSDTSHHFWAYMYFIINMELEVSSSWLSDPGDTSWKYFRVHTPWRKLCIMRSRRWERKCKPHFLPTTRLFCGAVFPHMPCDWATRNFFLRTGATSVIYHIVFTFPSTTLLSLLSFLPRIPAPTPLRNKTQLFLRLGFPAKPF